MENPIIAKEYFLVFLQNMKASRMMENSLFFKKMTDNQRQVFVDTVHLDEAFPELSVNFPNSVRNKIDF